jgi:hypothetical protein
MKLIEGLKRLRIIEKRIKSQNADITRYASMISTERPLFETEDRQKKEVKSLIQSNTDLIEEYLGLKRRIDLTNLSTFRDLMGKKFSIADLLNIQRKAKEMGTSTFKSLNDSAAQSRLVNMRHMSSDGKTPVVNRLFTEEERIKGLKYWQDLYDSIGAILEIMNATVDLIEE